MREFKGTKGNWVIKNTSTSSTHGVQKKGIFKENNQGFFDKSICNIDCNNEYGLPEHEANAKLISSAPELLETLQNFIYNDEFSTEDYVKAKELINKILE